MTEEQARMNLYESTLTFVARRSLDTILASLDSANDTLQRIKLEVKACPKCDCAPEESCPRCEIDFLLKDVEADE